MAFYHDMNKRKMPPKRRTYGAEEGSQYRNKERDSDSRGRRKDGSGRTEWSERLDKRFGRPNQARPGFRDTERRGRDQREERPIRKPFREEPAQRDHVPSFRDFEYKTEERKPAVDYRAEERDTQYILTGRNPIREALKNHRDLEKLLVQKGELSGSAMEIVQKAKEQKVMIQVVEKNRLDEIAPQHQGLIAFASAYEYATVEDILEEAKNRGEAPFILILDGITDPHNLGAIIRTAECCGAHGVIVPQHRSVGLTPAAVKASAGAVEYVKVARVTNLNRTIEDLQKQNIWVYALTMDGTDIGEVDFSGGVALVTGAEGDGVSQLTQTKCDMAVSIPMKGHLDSLNASVAAAIVMYRVMCSRG